MKFREIKLNTKKLVDRQKELTNADTKTILELKNSLDKLMHEARNNKGELTKYLETRKIDNEEYIDFPHESQPVALHLILESLLHVSNEGAKTYFQNCRKYNLDSILSDKISKKYFKTLNWKII